MRPHVWRYDATTPRQERPWIVSFHSHGGDGPDDRIVADPEDFETWADAMARAEDVARFGIDGAACYV